VGKPGAYPLEAGAGLGQVLALGDGLTDFAARAHLEKKLSVTTQENNVIISTDWYDPKVKYELVTLVQKNFLEEWQVQRQLKIEVLGLIIVRRNGRGKGGP
jgi:hypothetical protein